VNKKNKCPICNFFKDITKFAPIYQRLTFEGIAKAARDYPQDHGLELLQRVIAEIETVRKIEEGSIPT
jgi:hypothetical protein